MATKFITVSIEIMHDTKLNQSQKFILAEIEQLSQLDNGCYASNKHFSDLIGITKENVSRNINELKSMGYIDIEIEAGSRNHTRIITLTTLVRPPYQNSKTPLLKQQETKENIHNNKTININPLLSAYMEVDASITENGKNEILEFIEYRKKIKKPIRTIAPIKAYVKVIRELIEDGYKIEAIKDLMQQKEWQNIESEWVRKSIKKDEEERYEW
jgi:biotin operon repressor